MGKLLSKARYKIIINKKNKSLKNKPTRNYKQLNDQQKRQIDDWYNNKKFSIRKIANLLGKSPSTISRHLNTYITKVPIRGKTGMLVDEKRYSSEYAILEGERKRRKLKKEKIEIDQNFQNFLVFVKDAMKTKRYALDAAIAYVKKLDQFRNIQTPSNSTIRRHIETNRSIIDKELLKNYKKNSKKQQYQKRYFGTSIIDRPKHIVEKVEVGH